MINYVKKHWKGENSLAWAYWINGALFHTIFTFAITVAEYETSIFDSLVLSLLMAIGAMAFAIWSMVGIWRSASESIERAHTSKTSTFWAYAAKAMVIFGVFQILIIMVLFVGFTFLQ